MGYLLGALAVYLCCLTNKPGRTWAWLVIASSVALMFIRLERYRDE